jgi:hypothetical protein
MERARRQLHHRKRARHAAAIRHGGIARRTFNTRPSLETNATSIAKRMKKVWIALVGAMTSALPSGSESCFSRPRRRLSESNARSKVRATIRSLRAFVSTSDEAPD